MNFEFSGQIFEKKKTPSNMFLLKINPVGTDLFHADGRTDRA
jgi:hypothetical protein